MSVPVATPGLLFNDDDLAPTILNPMTGHILVTNKTGKRIIELCDGRRSTEAVAGALAQECQNVSIEEVTADVGLFLQMAADKGLVDWQDPA